MEGGRERERREEGEREKEGRKVKRKDFINIITTTYDVTQ